MNLEELQKQYKGDIKTLKELRKHYKRDKDITNLKELQKQYKKGKKLKYTFFWGHTPSKNKELTNACLSQWWNSEFFVDNIKYNTAEKYMMAQKAKLFGDDEIFKKIIASSQSKQIKAFGRLVAGFNNEIWDEHKYNIVVNGNFAKFSQNYELKTFLLKNPAKIIVEASPVDKVWGIGMAVDNDKIENPLFWKGENLLGFALMEVRTLIMIDEFIRR